MNIKAEITDKIIAAMESGASFTNIFLKGCNNGFPSSAITGIGYKGANAVTLAVASWFAGYDSNLWMTYKQASEQGGHVRKGEKATLCAYFDVVQKKNKGEQGEGTEAVQDSFFMCKPFYLFNIEQIDNLPEKYKNQSNKAIFAIDVIDQFINNTQARFESRANRCFYHREDDFINMQPIEQFKNVESYYMVKLHELTHWTGATKRLNRVKGKRYGDEAYAFEELVANLGSSFVCAGFGILDAELENHAGYLNSWIKVLKDDKNAIFCAAKLAFEAYNYLHGFQAQQAKAA